MAGATVDTTQVRRAADGLRRWSATMPAQVQAVAPQAAVVLLEASRAAINKKTGKTAASLRVALAQAGGMAILELRGNSVARMLATGTRPHDIYPVRARALRFVTRGGGVVYAQHVSHPGTRAYPWRQRAVGLAAPGLKALLGASARAAVTDLAGQVAA